MYSNSVMLDLQLARGLACLEKDSSSFEVALY